MIHSATHSTGTATVKAKAQVLLVGDWQHREFAAASANISDTYDWPHATNINEACDLLSHCFQPPELILLAQPLPGLFRQADIDRLQQLVPLTRLVLVAGSWCEGELRTGSPPNGIIRLYWYELASWWQAAIDRRDAGLCPPWSLPLDHAQAGRCSSANDLSQSKNSSLLSVLIDAADFAVYETLSTALDNYGINSSWKFQDENATAPAPAPAPAPANANANANANAGIWDGGQLSDCERTRLTNFCCQVDGPVIALLDFPRIEHFAQAQAAGAAAVLAKPYIVEELVAALTQK